MQRHVVSKDQSFYGTEIITSSVIIAGTIIVCHRYGIVEVAAHERLVLRIIDVESVVGRKDHIAVARLHNARDDDTAQSVFCQSGEHLALRLVYAARRFITERHPHPTLAVGIHIANLVVGQTHARRGHVIVLHGAQRTTVYLVYAVVITKPYIIASTAERLAQRTDEFLHHTKLVCLLVKDEEIASTHPKIAFAVVHDGPYHVATLADQRQRIVGYLVCGDVESRESAVIYSHPHRPLVGCHRHNVVAP